MPILEIFAIVVSTVAIVLIWRARQELKSLNGKLERLQDTLYDTRRAQHTQQQELTQQVAALDVAVQKATGNLRFDPDISLAQLYESEPRAQGILAAFHIGGCASCAVDENGTLAEAVRERGADLDKVLTALNTLPANGGGVDLRMPNVRFEI